MKSTSTEKNRYVPKDFSPQIRTRNTEIIDTSVFTKIKIDTDKPDIIPKDIIAAKSIDKSDSESSFTTKYNRNPKDNVSNLGLEDKNNTVKSEINKSLESILKKSETHKNNTMKETKINLDGSLDKDSRNGQMPSIKNNKQKELSLFNSKSINKDKDKDKVELNLNNIETNIGNFIMILIYFIRLY